MTSPPVPSSAPDTPAPSPAGAEVDAPHRSRLRRAALAVAVLAVLSAGAEVLRLVLQGLHDGGTTMSAVVGVAQLLAGLLQVGFIAAVLVLVSTGRLTGRRLLRPALAALCLLVLALLAAAAGQLLGVVLGLAQVGGTSPTGYGLRNGIASLVSTGGTVLMVLAIGVLALVLLLGRDRPLPVLQLRVGPVVPAVALLLAALGVAGTVLLRNGVQRSTAAEFDVLMTVSSLFAAVLSLLVALLALCAGMLLVLAPASVRRMVWIGMALYWCAGIVGTVLAGVQQVLLVSGGLAVTGWIGPVVTAVHVAGALLLGVCAAVALALLLTRSRRTAGEPPAQPIH